MAATGGAGDGDLDSVRQNDMHDAAPRLLRRRLRRRLLRMENLDTDLAPPLDTPA
jgi:hypothetical protein